jgi:hypothetical protein
MTLVLYPYPSVDGTSRSEDWHAIELRSLSGALAQAVGTRATPYHRLRLAFRDIAASDLADLLRTIRSGAGPLSRWHIWTPFPEPWVVAVGSGDGATRVWTVPVREVVGTPTVLVAGTQVAAWVGAENLLKHSENLSQASVWQAVGGATVTRTSGRTDPVGGSTAWRIQTSGGTYNEKLVQVRTDIATTTSSTWGVSCWLKNNGAKTVRVGIRYSGNPGTYVDVPAGAGWTEVRAAGSPTLAYYLGIEFRALSAGDALDFDLWHPAAAQWRSPWGAVTSPGHMAEVGYVMTGASPAPVDALGRAYLTLATAPASGAAIELRAVAKRLLWGRFGPATEVLSELPGRVSCALTFEGEEATGAET